MDRGDENDQEMMHGARFYVPTTHRCMIFSPSTESQIIAIGTRFVKINVLVHIEANDEAMSFIE
jgi:hypothetical protein